MAREDELLPSDKDIQSVLDVQTLKKDDSKICKVYTDVSLVKQFLNDKRFHLVSSEAEADILFIQRHFKNYR
jgi:hypothetical protein